MQFHNYYVYLLTTSDNSVFYTGFTNDLARRIVEHKVHLNKGFTDRYNITKLVYLSETIGVTKEIIESARNGIGVPGTSPGRQC